MKVYNIVSTIRIDGKRHRSGEIELSAKDAAPLLRLGVIVDESADDEAGSSENDDSGKSAADVTLDSVVRSVVTAMISEDPEMKNDEMWTKSGKPDVKYIESIVQKPVSAKLRDEVFAEIAEKDSDE